MRRSTLVDRFKRGEVFTFAKDMPSVAHIHGDVLQMIFSYADPASLPAMSEVNAEWFEISRSAIVCTLNCSLVYTSARQSANFNFPPTVKKLRGLDGLSEGGALDVNYVPYDFKIIPTYGPYANRRLRFVFAYDALICQCVLLHPYGKIIAGKTYFYLTESVMLGGMDTHRVLDHLTSLMHPAPTAHSVDTAVCSTCFKLVDGTRSCRPDMFTTQRGDVRATAPKVTSPWGHTYNIAPGHPGLESVLLQLPAGVTVAEVRCVLCEQFGLDFTQGILLICGSCNVLDDWEEMPPDAQYLMYKTNISHESDGLPRHLSNNPRPPAASQPITLTAVCPDIGGGVITFSTKQSIGMLKKSILNCTDDCNGSVMIQSRPGVVADDGDDHSMEGYAPHVFYEGGLIFAYVATTFVNATAISSDSSATVTVAAHRSWTVRTFLQVFFAALRRLSHFPPNDTKWCCVEHRAREEVPFPSRVSLFSSKVCIGNGPFLQLHQGISEYWDQTDDLKFIAVHFETSHD